MSKAQHALTHACTGARSCVYTRTIKNMWNKYKNHSNGDVGMGCTMRKIVETRKSPSIKDASTIMCNPSLHNSGKRVTHDCASILDRRGFPCLAIFRVVNPIPTSPFIQLNDFCTCSIIILAHPVSFVSSIFSFAKILHSRNTVSYQKTLRMRAFESL